MDAGLYLVDGNKVVLVQYIVQHDGHSQDPMRTGRLQPFVQLVYSIFTRMHEHDIIVLDGAATEHLYLCLFGYRSTIDSLFHFGRNRLFALVKRHVNDVEVACLQQLEKETFLLTILIILEFVSNIERQMIPWGQDVLHA